MDLGAHDGRRFTNHTLAFMREFHNPASRYRPYFNTLPPPHEVASSFSLREEHLPLLQAEACGCTLGLWARGNLGCAGAGRRSRLASAPTSHVLALHALASVLITPLWHGHVRPLPALRLVLNAGISFVKMRQSMLRSFAEQHVFTEEAAQAWGRTLALEDVAYAEGVVGGSGAGLGAWAVGA